jgi:hypothetical protein
MSPAKWKRRRMQLRFHTTAGPLVLEIYKDEKRGAVRFRPPPPPPPPPPAHTHTHTHAHPPTHTHTHTHIHTYKHTNMSAPLLPPPPPQVVETVDLTDCDAMAIASSVLQLKLASVHETLFLNFDKVPSVNPLFPRFSDSCGLCWYSVDRVPSHFTYLLV